MEHRRARPRGDLGRTANIARRDHIGGQLGKVGDLAVSQLTGDYVVARPRRWAR